MKKSVIKLMVMLSFVMVLGLTSFEARAALGCTTTATSFSPPLTQATLPIRGTYTGTLNISINCDADSQAYFLSIVTPFGSAKAATTLTGVTVSGGVPTVSSYSCTGSDINYIYVNTGSSYASNDMFINDSLTVCSMSASFPFTLTAESNAVSGNLDFANLVLGTYTDFFGDTHGPGGPSYRLGYYPALLASGPIFTSAQNLKVNIVGCTFSPTTQTFTLPPQGVNSLVGVGRTAARTMIPLKFSSCSNTIAGSNTSYNVSATWSFTPASNVGGNTTVLSNSAGSDPATDVYIQLLDSNQNPIDSNPMGNNTTTVGTVSASGGSITANYYAQYYSYSNTPGGGNVAGTATFILNYN